MGNYGARVVRFRLLRQITYFLSYGKAIYSEDGPQESRISRKILRFQSWSLLSEFCFLILGVQNVVADGLTSLSSIEILASKRHSMFVKDRIPRIFRLEGEGMTIAEKPGDIEGDDEEGAQGLEDLGEIENLVSLRDTKRDPHRWRFSVHE